MRRPRKVRLIARPVTQPGVKGGSVLRVSQSAVADYQREWEKLTRQMHEECVDSLRKFGKSVGTDAIDSITFIGTITALRSRLRDMFAEAAPRLARSMLERLDRSTTSGVERSLKDISENLTVRTNNPDALQALIDQRIRENVHYITKIPEKYLDGLTTKVQHAVQHGRGMADLVPIMQEQYGEEKRWARNVALDQLNKAHKAISSERMRQSGVRKFEWIHTGAAKEPRHYHMMPASQGGLNGGIFELDNPPIINLETGERGLPGDDYFCHCTMRPIVEFLDDE